MSLQNRDKNVRKIDIHHRAVAWASVCQCAGLAPGQCYGWSSHPGPGSLEGRVGDGKMKISTLH